MIVHCNKQQILLKKGCSREARSHQISYKKAPKDPRYCTRLLYRVDGEHQKSYCWEEKKLPSNKYCDVCLKEQEHLGKLRAQFRLLKDGIRPASQELYPLLPPTHFRVGIVPFGTMLRMIDIKSRISSLQNLGKYGFKTIQTAPGSSYLLLDEGNSNTDWCLHKLVRGNWSTIKSLTDFGVRVVSKLNMKGGHRPPFLKGSAEHSPTLHPVSKRTRSSQIAVEDKSSRFTNNTTFPMHGKPMGPYTCDGYCIRPGFVVTKLYMEDQPAHLDFTDIPVEDDLKPWIIHIPLCKEGMQLRINPDNSFPDKSLVGNSISVTVEFGSFLCMRGDVIHAGCYGNPGNIRMHMVVQQHKEPENPVNFELKDSSKTHIIHPQDIHGPIQCVPHLAHQPYHSKLLGLFSGAIEEMALENLPSKVNKYGQPSVI